MKKFNRIILGLVIVLLLQGCKFKLFKTKDAPLNKPTQIEYFNPQGKLVRVESNLSPEQIADGNLARANSDCWIGVTAAKQNPTVTGESQDPVLVLATALANSNTALAQSIANNNDEIKPCPMYTNSNDVKVNAADNKTKRSNGRWSGESLLGKVVDRGFIMGTAIGVSRELGGAFKNANDNAGTKTTINADNNSTVEGAMGADNNYQSNEALAGIPLNPANVEDIGLGGVAEINDDVSCLLAGGGPIFDEQGLYLRCSDGNGGDL